MDQAEKENLENQRLELGELEGTISVILEQEENKQQEQQEIINKRDEDMKGLVQQWKDGDIDTIEYQKKWIKLKMKLIKVYGK